jgi:hypothetical protein
MIAMLLLSACAMGGSDLLGHVCPPVVEYTTADQARAAAEVFILPEGRGGRPDAQRLRYAARQGACL